MVRESAILNQRSNESVAYITYFIEYLLTFTNLISGAFVITLEKDWFNQLDDFRKIPLYALVGSSLCFAFVYIFIDILEGAIEIWHYECNRQKHTYTPLVVSNLMHLVLLIATLTLGLLLGLIYSIFDVEQYWKETL